VSRRFTEAEIAEVWERRKAGEPTRSIARRLGRNGRRFGDCLMMLVGYLRHHGVEPSGT
jgi:hypothetical protein